MNKENNTNEKQGISFLNRLYKDLHLSDEVMHTASKSDTKDEKVEKYLDRLEKVEELAGNSKYNGAELLKELYYKKYVIRQENFPESYFALQKKIALERGYGRVEYSDNEKQEMMDIAIMDQKKSLDMWLDYLMSKDAMYPGWFKYYAFQGMLKLGEYDKEKGKFRKRTATTTSKFVDLNREALAYIYTSLVKMMNQEKIDDEDLSRLCEGGSFEKLYTYTLQKLERIKKDTSNKDGIWIKYNQGSDPEKLVSTLEGRGTGWCTAGLETARTQLGGGDFYVYYTKTDSGEYDQPRIAIRMEGTNIGEIRGIAEHQNMEPEMEEVLEEKLNEFPGKDAYLKKVSDMKRMTELYNQYKSRTLTEEELRFLYEVDEEIQGFGYRKDPRVAEILNRRNFKEDLALVFHCSPAEISNNKQDVLDGKKIICFYGNLILKDQKVLIDLVLPNTITGSLDLSGLTSADGLVLPNSINGNLFLGGLTSAEGLALPDSINGDLFLSGLTSAKGLILPSIIGGSLDLSGLTSAEGLVLPDSINGDLFLSGLTSAKGLILPSIIGGYLGLRGLTSAKGLILPSIIGGSLDLSGLTSAKELILPNMIGSSLDLSGLISAEGLALPDSIHGSLFLCDLTSAENLVLPNFIDGYLDLRGLTSAKGLILPNMIGSSLDLSGLISAEGLALPDSIHGSLFLRSLTSAKGLVLPSYIGHYLDLSGLISAEGLILSGNISWVLCMNNLKSLDGISFTDNFSFDGVFQSDYINAEEFHDKIASVMKEKRDIPTNMEEESGKRMK